MSQNNGVYEPGIYVNAKGDERVAKDAKAAVALTFDGYKLKKDGKASEDAKPAEGVTETPEEATPDDVTAESVDTVYVPTPSAVPSRRNR